MNDKCLSEAMELIQKMKMNGGSVPVKSRLGEIVVSEAGLSGNQMDFFVAFCQMKVEMALKAERESVYKFLDSKAEDLEFIAEGLRESQIEQRSN